MDGGRGGGASTLDEANRRLDQEFEGRWNERYQRKEAAAADAHRKLRKDQRLESMLSEVGERVAGNDYTLAWGGKRYQAPAERAKTRMRKRRVELERRLGDGVWLRRGDERIELSECREPAEPATATADRNRREGIVLHCAFWGSFYFALTGATGADAVGETSFTSEGFAADGPTG